jgi:excisionase family DNA binding protein
LPFFVPHSKAPRLGAQFNQIFEFRIFRFVRFALSLIPMTITQLVPNVALNNDTIARVLLALRDVGTELGQKLDKLVGDLSASSGSRVDLEVISKAISSNLEALLVETVMSGLVTARDEDAHARRIAMMRVLVDAEDVPAMTGAISQANSRVPFPDEAEILSGEQAAMLLRVSRPYINKLLDNGTIPGVEKTESGHRRIPKDAVLRYQAQMKARQAKATESVVNASKELGLYDGELDGIPEAPKAQ